MDHLDRFVTKKRFDTSFCFQQSLRVDRGEIGKLSVSLCAGMSELMNLPKLTNSGQVSSLPANST